MSARLVMRAWRSTAEDSRTTGGQPCAGLRRWPRACSIRADYQRVTTASCYRADRQSREYGQPVPAPRPPRTAVAPSDAPDSRSTGAASPTTRSSRAPSTTSRRRRTRIGRPSRANTWCSTSSRRAGTTSRKSILGVVHRPSARRGERLLPLATAAPLARPGHRRRARQSARARRRVQRRSRHRRRLQPAESRRPDRAADVRRRRLAVHAVRRLGAVDSAITPTCSASATGTARSASCSAAKRRSRRTASGRRSRWRRRCRCRCSSTSRTTDSAFRCAATCRRPAPTSRENLASFENLFVRNGDGTNPGETARLLAECVDHVRGGERSGARAAHRAAPVAATRARTISAAIAPTPRSPPTPSAIRCRDCARISFRR